MKKITIEVDESLAPDGYEIVAFRVANADDICLCLLDGGTRTGAELNSTGLPALILKKKRWRADKGREYHYISSTGIVNTDFENNTIADKDRHEAGNYYPPRSEEVLEAQKRVQAAYLGEGE